MWNIHILNSKLSGWNINVLNLLRESSVSFAFLVLHFRTNKYNHNPPTNTLAIDFVSALGNWNWMPSLTLLCNMCGTGRREL
jgi:hypothetical protein